MKNLFKYLAIFLLLGIGFLYFRNLNTKNESNTSNEAVTKTEVTVNLVIDFGNNNVKDVSLVASPEDTAFSILKTTVEKENIELKVKQYDFGVFVENIAGFESNTKKSWIYYINGESGQIAADQQKIKNEDKIEWKYEVPKL